MGEKTILGIALVGTLTVLLLGGDTMESKTAVYISILVMRLQIASVITAMNWGWPQWMTEIMQAIKDTVGLDFISLMAPECYMYGTAEEVEMRKLSYKAFATPVLIMLIYISLIPVRCIAPLINRQHMRGRAASVFAVKICYVALLTAAVQGIKASSIGDGVANWSMGVLFFLFFTILRPA